MDAEISGIRVPPAHMTRASLVHWYLDYFLAFDLLTK